MSEKIKITNRARNLIVLFLASIYILLCAGSYLATRSWINRPFPGFMVLNNNYVALLYLPEWEGFKREIKFGDVIVAVDGIPVNSAGEVLKIVTSREPGTPVTYSITRGEQRLQLTVPVALFTIRDYFLFFLVLQFIGFLFYSMGLVVYYLKSNSTASLTFLFFGSIVGLVAASIPAYCSNNFSFVFLFAYPLVGTSIFIISLYFPIEIKSRKRLLAILALINAIIIFFHFYFFNKHFIEITAVVVANIVIMAVLGFVLMSYSFISSTDSLVRQQAKIVIYGFFVGVLTISVGLVTFLLFLSVNIYVLYLSSIPGLFIPFSLGYAIVKHNLFDVEVFIRRSLSYLLMSGIALALFFGAIVLFSMAFQRITGQSSQIAAVLSTLLIVVLFRPLRVRIDRSIDRRFYREKYEYTTTIQRASGVLVSIIDLEQLLNRILETVLDSIRICRGCILLRGDESAMFGAAVDRGYEIPYSLTPLKTDHPIVRHLETRRRPIQKNDVQDLDEFQGDREEILRVMEEFDIVLLVPILYERAIIGMLGLGEKKSGAWYSSEDMELLKTLMIQTAVSIENARKVEKLKRMVEVETSYKRLKELDELKTQFFANISHEIRTPLTMCMAPLESMMSGEQGKFTRKQQELHSTMHRNMLRLLNLINNLLDFSKLEAGGMKPHVREEDIGAMARLMVSNVESWAERRGIDISCVVDRDLPGVFIDREKIEKVLLNLLSNAVKFTKNGGRIKVRVDEVRDRVEVSVSDTGVGIPKSAQEKIFERFSQVDGSSSREYEGTGIGLALVKEFVELHGGRVWVESEEDEGSTFFFEIPVGKDHLDPDKVEFIEGEAAYDDTAMVARSMADVELEETQAEQSVDTVQEDRPLVLVVEDNVDMRRFVKDILSSRFQVETAKDGEQGLALAREVLPDLVLSDVMMPLKDGYELCRDLKTNEKTRRIPVILVTARAEMKMKLEGLEQGADDYLIKPFNSQELLTRVENLIRYRSLEQRMMESKLARFLSPQIARQILRGGDDLFAETKRKNLTILFSDIRGFTALSSEMEPEKTTELLNHYLTEMSRIVFEYEGTLDKFIGDGLMVFFNDPVDQEDHAARAVKMALAMQQRMDELQEEWFQAGSRPLSIGIGINTGHCTVGGFGSEHHMDYTAIGTQVNLAARLQTEASEGEIIISHATYGATKDIVEVEDRGEVTVKGLHQAVKIYHVKAAR
jgi:signal transduction histidine kinase/class 3 adenylate cyclase